MESTYNYIKYIISKTDDFENIKLYKYVKKLNSKIFNIKNINSLLDDNNFKEKFNYFAELHGVVPIDAVLKIKFLNGIITYIPRNHSLVFHCGNDSVMFRELYNKRTKKIIAHIILENRYDELIHSIEELILQNV